MHVVTLLLASVAPIRYHSSRAEPGLGRGHRDQVAHRVVAGQRIERAHAAVRVDVVLGPDGGLVQGVVAVVDGVGVVGRAILHPQGPPAGHLVGVGALVAGGVV